MSTEAVFLRLKIPFNKTGVFSAKQKKRTKTVQTMQKHLKTIDQLFIPV